MRISAGRSWMLKAGSDGEGDDVGNRNPGVGSSIEIIPRFSDIAADRCVPTRTMDSSEDVSSNPVVLRSADTAKGCPVPAWAFDSTEDVLASGIVPRSADSATS